MHEHNFDEILDFLCSGIMSQKERQSVRDELYDHLMCKYEINLAVGHDEEQAEKKAIEELGDVSTLRFKLGQVHSYAPKPSLKKAMNLLIFGYVLTSFHLSFFNGMKEITTFIATVCMLVALFCFRTANKKLKVAFILKTISSVLSWIAYAVNPIYSLSFIVSAVIGVFANLLSPVSVIFMILGIKELVVPHIGTFLKKIPFDAAVFFNGFIGLINVVIFGFIIDDGDLNAEFESISLFGIMLICIILNLVVFFRSSKVLWNSDHEYRIEDSASKKWIAALVVTAVAVVPRVAIDISLANQKAEISDYTIEDYIVSDEEYERICTNLLSYDIPEEIVYNLPKSEIVNYSGCVAKDDLNERDENYLYETVSTFENMICNDVNVKFSVCAIGMNDKDGYPYVRVLSWVDYLTTSDYAYSDAVFWKYHEERNIPLNYEGKYNGNFLLILSDENGKIEKNKPLDIYTDKDALTDRMIGVRFEAKKDLLIIHAEDFGLASTYKTRNANYAFDFFHRTTPFSLFYPSPFILFNTSDYMADYFEYRRLHVTAYICWEIPEIPDVKHDVYAVME
ncbi:MAG: hypothetical protein IJB16_04445 [Clostridia bacterium]|nr:hypothetical protein [Clostridia bacterium]